MKIKKCAGAPLSWNLAFLRENARFEKKITDEGCLFSDWYIQLLSQCVSKVIHLFVT